jgi:hypothetical protein
MQFLSATPLTLNLHAEKGLGPEAVAQALLEIVSSKTMLRLRYLIGGQANTVARLRRFLPAGMYKYGARRCQATR